MSPSDSSHEIKTGRPAVVVDVSESGGRLVLKFANGESGTVTNDEQPFHQKVGDVVLIDVNESALHDADPTSWPEPKEVGVVRKVLSDQLLIEGDYKFHLVPNKDPDHTSVGQTVVFDEISGIHRKLDDSPIVRRLGVSEDTTDSNRYRWKIDPLRKLSFEDFGGYPEVVERSRELIETPLKFGDKLKEIGARPIKGVLFTGPPGTGKTHLARIIADQSDAAFFTISGPEVISKWVGDSEGNLRNLFDAAKDAGSAVVFFDEIDSLAERRSENSHESSKRVVAQLLTLMDGFQESNSELVVIAATNRPDDIDPALRRPGRFDWEINFPMPNSLDRLQILRVSMERLTVAQPLEMPLEEVASQTEGWSAARITSLWTEAALLAAADGRGSLRSEDLVGALERVNARSASGSGQE